MTGNLSKALLTLSATILVVAATATSSDARPHAKRLSPTYAASSMKAAPDYVFTEDASTHNGG
jgi:hypothetical protein